MKIKLENLINFNDFKSKNVKESISSDNLLPEFNLSNEDKIEKTIQILDTNVLSEDVIKDIVNDLRDVLLEMEQKGLVSTETTDELDDKHSTDIEDIDWQSWIIDVIQLPDFPKDSIDKVYEIVEKFSEIEDNVDLNDWKESEDELSF